MTERPKFNVLIAVPYLSAAVGRLLRTHERDIRFFLDSGAFTAWKAGRPMPMADYVRALEESPVEPWRYFTLDVIGDPEGTLRNLDYLLGRGYRPVPIFTRGESPARLEYFFAHSDLVAIGGLVGTPGNKGFVKGIAKHAGGRDLHLLGFTAHDFISGLRPFSCDSSNWSSSTRYGVASVYLGRGRWARVSRRDLQRTKPPAEVMDGLRALGIDPYRFRVDHEWVNTSRGDTAVQQVGFASWIRYSIDVERQLGTKLFLACANEHHVRLFLQEYERVVT